MLLARAPGALTLVLGRALCGAEMRSSREQVLECSTEAYAKLGWVQGKRGSGQPAVEG